MSTLIKLSINRNVYEITEKDEFMDDGVCVQLLTQSKERDALGFFQTNPVLSQDDVNRIGEFKRVGTGHGINGLASIFSLAITGESEKESIVMNVEEILINRGGRYGSFRDGAQISQSLKEVMTAQDNWHLLSNDKKESLQMIVLKISRILNGDAEYRDSWDDISGYAQLVAKGLK